MIPKKFPTKVPTKIGQVWLSGTGSSLSSLARRAGYESKVTKSGVTIQLRAGSSGTANLFVFVGESRGFEPIPQASCIRYRSRTISHHDPDPQCWTKDLGISGQQAQRFAFGEPCWVGVEHRHPCIRQTRRRRWPSRRLPDQCYGAARRSANWSCRTPNPTTRAASSNL